MIFIEHSPDINVLFDYLAVSFPVQEEEKEYQEDSGAADIQSYMINTHFQALCSIMGIPDTQEYTDDGKVQFYDKMITYGEHIVFKFRGPKNSQETNIHSLELKGEGCREVERLGIDWYSMLIYIHENELNVSTLHIAGDIFSPDYFTMDQLLTKAKRKEYISFSRKFSFIESSKDSEAKGTSLYFGNRADNQINIYDKKNERYFKGYDVDTNTWIRIEIRLKTNKTFNFIRLFIVHGMEELPSLFAQTLRGMLEYKQPSKNTYKKSNWKIWHKWEKFLGHVPSIKIKNQAKLESTLARKGEWLFESGGLIMMEYSAGIDVLLPPAFNDELIKRKREKLTHKSLKRVNDLRISKKLQPFETLENLKDWFENSNEGKVVDYV